jgi:hypothetical protein
MPAAEQFGCDPSAGCDELDLALDGAGQLYVSGGFQGTVNFGRETRTSNGSTDLFIWKRPPLR